MRDFFGRFYFFVLAVALVLLVLVLAVAGHVATAQRSSRTQVEVATARPAGEANGPALAAHRDRFAVSSENPLATRIGMARLRAGGNAADAAIAVALSLGVLEPASSGIGGGGFALVWDAARRKMTALDFREVAPGALDPAALEYRSKAAAASGRGRMIGVPGEVAGLLELHRRFAKRPLAEDVAPAVELAEKGFYVSAHLATMTLAYHAELEWSPPLRALFKPDGWAAPLARHLVNPALASTLRAIGQQGARAFYQGKVADEIVAAAASVGGVLQHADLESYRVVEREPLRVLWEGHAVYTMPPPSAGGLLVAETLGMFTRGELEDLKLGSGAYDHLLAETFRSAISDRMRAIGDPAFVNADMDRLLEKMRLRDRRAQIAIDRTRASPRFSIHEHGTSHLIVVDEEGNVVSLTTTVNNAFGAMVSTATTGVVLNDQLDDFTTRAASAMFSSGQGSIASQVPNASSERPGPNEPRPFARPTSSMTPTIVLRDGLPVLVAGGSGGLRIATGVAQALLAKLVFQRPARDCVALPRIHTPMDDVRAVLELDPESPDDVVADLRARGELVRLVPNYSAVQMIAIDRRGDGVTIDAAADPRKGGDALVE